MAFPDHWLLSWGGSLYGGQDEWSNGIRFATPDGGGPGQVDETAMVQDFATQLSAFVASNGSGYSNAVAMEWVKFNQIAPNGGYVDEGTTHVVELGTAVKGPTTPAFPPQISLCVSFLTPVARGYASKGRLYVPVPGLVVQVATGRVATTALQGIADSWATFLEELGNMPGLDLTDIVPSIVSRTPLAGAQNPINGVRVGDVLDTQQRRRNAMVETYVAATVAL